MKLRSKHILLGIGLALLAAPVSGTSDDSAPGDSCLVRALHARVEDAGSGSSFRVSVGDLRKFATQSRPAISTRDGNELRLGTQTPIEQSARPRAVRPPSPLETKGEPVLPVAELAPQAGRRYQTVEMDPKFKGEEAGRPPLDPITGLPRRNWHVTYLTEAEREPYRVIIKDGIVYNSAGVRLQGRMKTYIFVMDEKGNFYLGEDQHLTGKFHHSSFLAGRPVAGAGELTIENGVIRAFSRQSGHYKLRVAVAEQALAELLSRGVDVFRLEILDMRGSRFSSHGRPRNGPGSFIGGLKERARAWQNSQPESAPTQH